VTSMLESHRAGAGPTALPPRAPAPHASPRLLAGPQPERGAESFAEHRERLGARPTGGDWMIEVLERSGLRGRGGGWFPAGRKWRAVSDHVEERPALVVVNASEGEPLSAKDRTLALHRPHLILDGAQVAAESVGAEGIVIYLSSPSRPLVRALHRSLRERRDAGVREVPVRVVRTAHRYVAGESSAVVRRLNGGPSKPGFAPPYPSERGVGGRPTLVHNAETIANTALVARFGDAWFRARGTAGAPGTALVTLSGSVRHPGVYEIDVGTPLVDAIGLAGGVAGATAGVLVGGYAGTWIAPAAVAHLPLTPDEVALGCGVLGVLGGHGCGLSESARIADYLARQSAGQCGPCVHGLRAIADAMLRIAASDANPGDLERVRRWALQVTGRGGCHHPDGAIHNVVSALEAFPDHLALHLRGMPCHGWADGALPPPPRSTPGWR